MTEGNGIMTRVLQVF
jgi:hypothetical protein